MKFFKPPFEMGANLTLYLKKNILKTGKRILDYLNEMIGTPRNCIAVSHARRFGKSHAAGMIDAYYSRGCDSTKLF